MLMICLCGSRNPGIRNIITSQAMLYTQMLEQLPFIPQGKQHYTGRIQYRAKKSLRSLEGCRFDKHLGMCHQTQNPAATIGSIVNGRPAALVEGRRSDGGAPSRHAAQRARGVHAGRGEEVTDPSDVWEPEERQEMWQAAHDKTLHELFKQGKIVVV